MATDTAQPITKRYYPSLSEVITVDYLIQEIVAEVKLTAHQQRFEINSEPIMATADQDKVIPIIYIFPYTKQ